ncbi:MAG: HEAT repeat domain-containing protein [Candidatus Obscuribacter sp.]|nr:HEAT repeat domain-containing protein [Candidatus Obscuribacter sp.]
MERARSVKIPPRGPAEKLVDFQARLHQSWGFRAVVTSFIFEPLMEMVSAGKTEGKFEEELKRFEFKSRNDAKSLQALLEIALSREDGNVKALWALRHKGGAEVFALTSDLCLGGDDIAHPTPRQRQLGTCILSQMARTPRRSPRASIEVLLTMLNSESDENVILSIIYALGHLRGVTRAEQLSQWLVHPDEYVRIALVNALPFERNKLAIDALIVLTKDPSDEVRDLAAFGLGFFEGVRSSAINAALLECLSDPYEMVRLEAMNSLEGRGVYKKRVVKALLADLERGCDFGLPCRIAKTLASVELYDALVKLRTAELSEDLEEAILACQPCKLALAGGGTDQS